MADDIKKMLDSAKSALKNANDFSASAGDSGMFKPKAQPKPQAPAPKVNTGMKREAEDAGKGIKARMENEGAALGSMKKGGKVHKEGLYHLHKDEVVVPADKAKNMGADALGSQDPQSKLHMNIEPTDNKGYVVRHEMRGGKEPMAQSKIHSLKNAKELIAHIKEHYQDSDEPTETQDAPAGQ